MRMLLTGEPVDAVTASRWGLINEAVPGLELESRTRKLAHTISTASSTTVRLGKRSFYNQIDLDQQAAYVAASEVMALNAIDADAQEGIAAFLEKRKPTWK